MLLAQLTMPEPAGAPPAIGDTQPPLLAQLSTPDTAGPGLRYTYGGPVGIGIAAPAAAAGAAAGTDTAIGSLLGPLSAEALAGLAELAAGVIGPTLFFGILFIPAPNKIVTEGTVAGAPDL
jgi:hypothetical protein